MESRVVATIRDPRNRSVATVEAHSSRLLFNVKQTAWQKVLAPLRRWRIDLGLDRHLYLIHRHKGVEQLVYLAVEVDQRSKGKLRTVLNSKSLQKFWLAELQRAYKSTEEYVSGLFPERE